MITSEKALNLLLFIRNSSIEHNIIPTDNKPAKIILLPKIHNWAGQIEKNKTVGMAAAAAKKTGRQCRGAHTWCSIGMGWPIKKYTDSHRVQTHTCQQIACMAPSSAKLPIKTRWHLYDVQQTFHIMKNNCNCIVRSSSNYQMPVRQLAIPLVDCIW